MTTALPFIGDLAEDVPIRISLDSTDEDTPLRVQLGDSFTGTPIDAPSEAQAMPGTAQSAPMGFPQQDATPSGIPQQGSAPAGQASFLDEAHREIEMPPAKTGLFSRFRKKK